MSRRSNLILPFRSSRGGGGLGEQTPDAPRVGRREPEGEMSSTVNHRALSKVTHHPVLTGRWPPLLVCSRLQVEAATKCVEQATSPPALERVEGWARDRYWPFKAGLLPFSSESVSYFLSGQGCAKVCFYFLSTHLSVNSRSRTGIFGDLSTWVWGLKSYMFLSAIMPNRWRELEDGDVCETEEEMVLETRSERL